MPIFSMHLINGVLSIVNSGKDSEWEWKIEDLLGHYCSWSPELRFERESWQFRVCREAHGYIGFRVFRSSDGTPIEVEFSAALKAIEGEKSFERHGKMCFVGQRSYYEIEQWICESELRNRQREFLSSRCFTILITMKKVDSESKILHDLKQMFLSQENCDVVLRVGCKEYLAHKNILVARSPVFACMFRSNMKETVTGTVDIEDVDPSCFPEFLCFLYCGEVEKLSAENVRSLFVAADKYDMKDLRTICVEFMKKNLSVDAFCETLMFSLLYSESDLIDACTDFFVQNAGKIIETEQWQTFAAENPLHNNNLFIKYVKATTRSNS